MLLYYLEKSIDLALKSTDNQRVLGYFCFMSAWSSGCANCNFYFVLGWEDLSDLQSDSSFRILFRSIYSKNTDKQQKNSRNE